ncbi:MAG: CRISPR-associated protein Cas4 [Thermoproteota archaeon]|jgi:CRISPR-associated exonuclease Cas4
MINSLELIDQKTIFTGTQISYFVVCPTKLWLFSHFTTLEKGSDLVQLGKLLQQTSYRETRKDLIVDQKIAIDFLKRENELILHEVKKSSKLEEAHIMQLAYYLYFLKNEKGIESIRGVINYPRERKIIEVKLTREKEKEIEEILRKVKEVISLPKPPKPEYKKYCRKCAYFELCFSE